ncbi:MAG: hypothetical protein QOD93_3448, partial [Acetobacteraceae bacterium]|nr:hypothetical protein [Acetobacteraceae bacterium]
MSKCALEFAHDAVEGQPCPLAFGPDGSMFGFLAAHRQDLFCDKEFEDLFPSGRGRPSIPASVMASILVL